VSNISVGNQVADEWLKDLLLRNDFEAQQTEWFRGAIRDGDSYVMVDPITKEWSSEPAYDGFSGVEVVFDKKGKPKWACKLWSESDIQDVKETDDSASTNTSMKIIVYQPDRISSYKGMEGTYSIEEDEIIEIQRDGSLSFTQDIAWNIGKLPLVRFVNQKDNYTSYGESELRPAIPVNDSLNSEQHDKTMASKLSAFSQYWSIGFELDNDGVIPGAVHNLVLRKEDGSIETNPTPEQLAFLQACQVGQFQGADITQYTNQIEKDVMQICQITQTPVYGVTSEGNLSGEALKQLEIGLIGKVERFQRQNTDAMKELITLTAEIQNEFEGESAPSFNNVAVVWRSPELLDVNSRISALAMTRSQFPGLWSDDFYRERIGSLLGLSKDDIAKETEKAVQRKKEQQNESNFFANTEE
jgi:hypothetical protein